MKRYYVYILTNKSKSVLYTGVTNNLNERIRQHCEDSSGTQTSFAGKYKCVYLLYYEEYHSVTQAISREKEIKGWTRNRKMELIKALNPECRFLNETELQ